MSDDRGRTASRSVAASALHRRLQNTSDLARRRWSAGSACWTARGSAASSSLSLAPRYHLLNPIDTLLDHRFVVHFSDKFGLCWECFGDHFHLFRLQ